MALMGITSGIEDVQMNGLNNYYYTKITDYKRSIRNQLFYFIWGEDETITTCMSHLAFLFIVDADNIDKEFYNEQEYELVKSIITAFLNDQDDVKVLDKKEAKMFIDLALHKRLTREDNLLLIRKVAGIYNKHCYNKMLRIDEDVLEEVNDTI